MNQYVYLMSDYILLIFPFRQYPALNVPETYLSDLYTTCPHEILLVLALFFPLPYHNDTYNKTKLHTYYYDRSAAFRHCTYTPYNHQV